MFEGFKPFTITTQSDPKVDIVGLQSDNTGKPPLLLLHGFPQTYHIWHRIAPQLTGEYTVVLFDIRGYGQSSKPEDLAAYAKSAMARDCTEVMSQLGFDTFFVCAHDRGARVAHKLCVDHAARVRRAILLDICPTLAMYEATGFDFARAYFHWFLLIQPAPLPETMLLSDPRKLAQMWMGGRQGGAGLRIFDERCFDHYVRGLEDPATVHAMCQDYRASATLDLDEARADLKAGRRIQCPLKVIWGKNGVIEKCFDAVKEWRAVADDGVPVDGYSVESGHYIPEEAPEAVLAEIRGFFASSA